MDYPRGVRPKGDSIQIRWEFRGRKYSETIPKKPNKTNLLYAVKVRQDRINALKYGIRSTKDRGNPDFASLAQKYLDTFIGALSTRNSYRDILNRYWLPELAEIPIQAISYLDLLEIDGQTEWPSAKTRKNAIIPLRQVFKLAIKAGIISNNVAASLESGKHQKPELEPFSYGEKAAILANMAPESLLYFTLAFETGARVPGELNALLWSDFDGEALVINKAFVRHKLKHSTKTGHSRRVLLTQAGIVALNAQPRPIAGGNIFLNTDGGPLLDGKYHNQRWRAALVKANVPYRRAYTCRHTYASHGLMAGAKPGFLAKQLGHTLEMFFNTYAQWMESDSDAEELAKIEKTGQKLARGSEGKR